jgi:hypothetical protein
MKKIFYALFSILAIGSSINAQNVGIGTATPAASAKLDITDANRGLLIPRVALTATNVAAPVTAPATSLLVYNTNTAGAGATAVSPGFYYWNVTQWVRLLNGESNDWRLLGNAGTSAALNFIGTTDAVDFVTRTNNTERMRVTSTGTVGIGTATPLHMLDINPVTNPTWTSNSWRGLIGLNDAAAIGWRNNFGGTRAGIGHTSNGTVALNDDAMCFFTTNSELGTNGSPAVYAMKIYDQNNLVTINNGATVPDASAQLDVTSTNRGVLIPRVALTATNLAGPVTTPTTSLLVYNTATAGTVPNNVTPGFYYWGGAAWIRLNSANNWLVGTTAATTNPLTTTGFIGTSTSQHVDFVTNGVVRGRLSNLGEFFIGTTATALVGDLMNGVGNATFPWALNGYTNFNGAGVYGAIQGANTTSFAAVQGENNSTSGNINTAAVRGINASATAGTGFRTLAGTGPRMGTQGTFTAAGSYSFGVFGSSPSITTRTGAVLGNNFGIRGALGYYANNGLDYAVYGFGGAYQAGIATGRPAVGGNNTSSTIYNDGNTELAQNTNIGLGIYGGVMGGWVRGLKYGFNAKGETYSLYVDGQSFTNEPVAYLMPTATDERVAGFMSTSLKAEVSDKGKIQLRNGRVFVAFDDNFKKVMSTDLDDLIITATPQGNSAGVYISQISIEGFWIFENNNGQSNVNVAWTAISPVEGRQNIAEELLSKEFDRKMDKVMYNENNTDGTAQPLWWDGTQMRWDAPPAKQADPNAVDFRRPTGGIR